MTLRSSDLVVGSLQLKIHWPQIRRQEERSVIRQVHPNHPGISVESDKFLIDEKDQARSKTNREWTRMHANKDQWYRQGDLLPNQSFQCRMTRRSSGHSLWVVNG